MGDISPHFNRSEFKCKCNNCDMDTVDVKLIEVLERLRAMWNLPITINSGNRCKAYNKAIGGSKKSQHTKSRAADIVVHGKDPFVVYKKLDEWYPYEFGMGRYDTFTHIDTRTGRARWKG